ncbi:MAG: phosphoribosylglycinamide synthetase C domain-containing protein [Planctomycetota bacterium]
MFSIASQPNDVAEGTRDSEPPSIPDGAFTVATTSPVCRTTIPAPSADDRTRSRISTPTSMIRKRIEKHINDRSSGLRRAKPALPFLAHAGTRSEGNVTLTNGGRVLGVTALGETIGQARSRAYEAVDTIHFEGAFCRRDIAARAV